MRKFQYLLYVLKQQYICFYIICMTVPSRASRNYHKILKRMCSTNILLIFLLLFLKANSAVPIRNWFRQRYCTFMRVWSSYLWKLYGGLHKYFVPKWWRYVTRTSVWKENGAFAAKVGKNEDYTFNSCFTSDQLWLIRKSYSHILIPDSVYGTFVIFELLLLYLLVQR